MKRSSRVTAGFSMVEIVVALGVAAFALLAIMGMLPAGLKVQQASIQQTTANEIISEIANELRAAARLPPGIAAKLDKNDSQQNKIWTLNKNTQQRLTPDWLYFTNEGEWTGGTSPGTMPSNAAFVATILYRLPPSDTTSLADVVVSWPAAAVNPQTATGTPAGSVERSISITRQ
jgi:type II secretory pathway pseudopilin PulG